MTTPREFVAGEAEEVFEPETDTRAMRFRDITLDTTAKPVIKGIAHAGEVVVIYGAAKSGKTFYVFHLGLDVANGRPHRGRRTRRGLVVHVALESVSAIRARAVAYRQATGETDVPYVLLDWRLDLFDSESRRELQDTLHQLEAEHELPLVLLIVDTLARAIPGRDENSKELGDAIAYAQELVRHEFPEAAAVVVHHAGKDAGRGTRGHSSVVGNADGILLVENREGLRTVAVDVHRNATQGDTVAAFELQPVTIGTDDDGDAITSCTLLWIDAPAERPGKTLTPTERMALDTLREAIKTHGEYPPPEVLNRNKLTGGERVVECEHWRDIYYRRRTSPDDTPEAKKKAFQRARDRLQMSRLIQCDAGYYWPLKASGQTGQGGTP